MIPAQAWAAEATARGALEGPWLLGALLLCYLMVRLLNATLGARLGWLFGPELLVAGLLIGPGLGLIAPDSLDALATFGCATLGLILGARLDVRAAVRGVQRPALRLALAQAVVATALGVGLLLGSRLLPASLGWQQPALAAVLALAALVIVSDAGPLRALSARLGVGGPGLALVVGVSRWSAAIAILIQAAGAGAARAAPAAWMSAPGWLIWPALTLVAGLGCGALAWLLMRQELSRGVAAAAALGVLLLGAAIASELVISALAIGMLAGMVIAPTRALAALPEVLSSELDRALCALLFFYLGVHWLPGASMIAFLMVPVALLVRYAVRGAALTLGSLVVPATRGLPAPGGALWATGATGAALVVEFLRCWPQHAQFGAELYACLALTLALTEPTARSRARRWLLDVRASQPPSARG